MANAIKSVMTKINMLLCSRHKYPHILRRTSSKTAAVYKEAVNAVTPEQLATALASITDDSMDDAHKLVMAEFTDEQLYSVAAVAVGLTTYGRSVSQLIESLNNSNIPARNLDPFSALRWFAEKEMKRYYDAVEVAHSGNPNDFLNHVKQAMKVLAAKQIGMHVTFQTLGKYLVRSGAGNNYLVLLPRVFLHDNLAAFGSCECGLPLVKHMPCKHMYAACMSAGISLDAIVPHSFGRPLLRLLFPKDKHYPNVAVDNVKSERNRNAYACPATVGAATQGRPTNARIRSFLEYAALRMQHAPAP